MKERINPILLDEVKKKAKELAAMRAISKEITSSLNLDKVLTTVMDRALELLDAKKGCILLIDPDTKKLKITIARGLSEDDVRKFGEQALDDVFESEITPSFLSVPFKIKNNLIGVINITNGSPGKKFSKRHLETLKELADQASIAIDNATAHYELRRVVLNTIKSLAVSIDQKDHYTRSHSETVTRYAVAIAREMDLSEEQIEKIGHAAELHDIGKIGIRDYILSKPGKLSEEEWEEMKTHSAKGADILGPLEFLNGIIDIVKQHHERADGKGYPNGVKKTDIVIGARVLAIADSFEAMTSDRPYRKAMSREAAIEEIKRSSGIMYDPEVVDAFLRAIDKKSI